jgi:hypothetical protein
MIMLRRGHPGFVILVVVTLLTAGAAACAPSRSDPPGTAPPGTVPPGTVPTGPQGVASGTLLGAAGDLRLLRVENPTGAPGCEGAPTPDLRAVRAGADPGETFDPAPDVELSAGGNRLLTRDDGRLAVVTFCEGFPGDIWLATATPAGLTDVHPLPPIDPGPSGPLLVTAWDRDGTALLATATVTGGEHRAVAIDTVTGAVRDLGTEAYWVGQLRTGALVADQATHILVGDHRVPVAGDLPAGAARHLNISPDGDRVAIGTTAGLTVADADGAVHTWTTEPVLGVPVWSPDGSAVVYPTGPQDALSGELHVAHAAGTPVGAAPDAVVFEPAAVVEAGGRPRVLYTAPGPEAGAPEGRHVEQVPLPDAAKALPENPRAYARAVEAAWTDGDRSRLDRLTTEPVGALLRARPARPADGWHGPECGGATGDTYCRWTGTASTLLVRVRNALASRGEDHATIGASFRAPPGGVALWPVTTFAEATNQQAEVDQGSSPWLVDPATVARFFARDRLGWSDVRVTRQPVGDSYDIIQTAGTGDVGVTLVQPARSGPGGIWAVLFLHPARTPA